MAERQVAQPVSELDWWDPSDQFIEWIVIRRIDSVPAAGPGHDMLDEQSRCGAGSAETDTRPV
ncbi:hypothetical protein GOAMI_16_01200 [Gordonia amicalis NBRC 100051 = JCM 11271]|nr:hypothetical protein GOAMI_16_01200 [Gordonia amicalis NBRC 100051 = JCM 11271]